VIPLAYLLRVDVSRLSRGALRAAWHLALWARDRGLMSREAFRRLDGAYRRRIVLDGWRRAA